MNDAAESKAGPPRRREHVASLERGLAVLEILAGEPAGLTLSETAARAGLTRAGARRLLLTLVDTGHARQAGRRFFLTSRLLSLARSWLDGASLWSHAEPFMREVSAKLGESCSAGVLADQDVIYVARVPGKRIMSVALHVGARLPAYCTSMGRVLLAGLEPAARAAVLEKSAIEPSTAKTVTDRDALLRMVAQAADEGYALVDEELEIGLRSVAVPVRDRDGRVAAAINVSTQSQRYSCAAMRRDILPLLKGAASEIEAFFAVQ